MQYIHLIKKTVMLIVLSLFKRRTVQVCPPQHHLTSSITEVKKKKKHLEFASILNLLNVVCIYITSQRCDKTATSS